MQSFGSAMAFTVEVGEGVGFVEGSFVGSGDEEADAVGFALPDGVASSAEGVQAARITTPARMSAAAAPSRSFMPTE
ncbi:hypothetical protein MIAR_19850 [Microbacterium arabinogalactanolyticum]|nr:hypothetical protein MIAR_19850 [Microbacterium arabinogalactanolyticum]